MLWSSVTTTGLDEQAASNSNIGINLITPPPYAEGFRGVPRTAPNSPAVPDHNICVVAVELRRWFVVVPALVHNPDLDQYLTGRDDSIPLVIEGVQGIDGLGEAGLGREFQSVDHSADTAGSWLAVSGVGRMSKDLAVPFHRAVRLSSRQRMPI